MKQKAGTHPGVQQAMLLAVKEEKVKCCDFLWNIITTSSEGTTLIQQFRNSLSKRDMREQGSVGTADD